MRFAGFSKNRGGVRNQDRHIWKVKAGIVGANRQHWNKGNAWPIAETSATASDQSGDDSQKSFDEQAVRLRHLSTNAEGRAACNPGK